MSLQRSDIKKRILVRETLANECLRKVLKRGGKKAEEVLSDLLKIFGIVWIHAYNYNGWMMLAQRKT